MATFTLTKQIDGAGMALSRQHQQTASGVVLIDGEQVATATTDGEINFDLDVSACKAFYLVSDQDVTLETNSGSEAANTIALKAGKPYDWYTGDYNAFLLTVDVTSVFITNTSGATATIYCVAGYDATPA